MVAARTGGSSASACERRGGDGFFCGGRRDAWSPEETRRTFSLRSRVSLLFGSGVGSRVYVERGGQGMHECTCFKNT